MVHCHIACANLKKTFKPQDFQKIKMPFFCTHKTNCKTFFSSLFLPFVPLAPLELRFFFLSPVGPFFLFF